MSDVPLVHVGDGTDQLKYHHAGLRGEEEEKGRQNIE
jgi:hypothetical protein